jgi:hypothetical protein
MRHQLKFSQTLTMFLLFTGFISCKSPSGSDTGFDSNGCTEYGCPVHPDKMFVAPQKCPECGLQMILKGSIDSILVKIKKSSLDSLDLYHKLIIEQSGEIMKNDTLSKEEQIQYLVEATKNLKKAKTVNENLDQLVYGKRFLAFKPHYKKLDRLYTVASYRITNISDELGKERYDKEKIRLYATELRETIYEVDKEQHVIRVK